MIRRAIGVIGLVILTACGSPSDPNSVDPESSAYFLKVDHTMRVDGMALRYRDEGPKNAQPIVMIHGFTSSLESWDGIAPALAENFRVIRLDLPGHGLTGPDSQNRYSNDETVELFAAFMARLDLNDPVVIGNSLGGLVAWRYAHAYPEKARALVLISPGGFSINGVTDQPVKVPAVIQYYLTQAPKAGVDQALAALYGDAAKLPESRAIVYRDMMQVPGNGDAFIRRAETFTLPDPTADLQNLTQPVLLLWGDQDVMVPVAHAEKFSEAISNAKVIIYPGAGHIPQEEIPETIATDIRTFLLEPNP